MKQNQKEQLRFRRHRRVRAKIQGTQGRPRLCIFRSNRHVELQLIDDDAGKTIMALRDYALAGGKKPEVKTKRAEKLALEIAKKAVEGGIISVVFDRGGYAYHGIVKAAAEGARKGGLLF